MSRVTDIVSILLDLCEDLDSRLFATPVDSANPDAPRQPGPLLRQFASDFRAEEIKEMAAADPTIGPPPKYEGKADYITWLCTMRRSGAWGGDVPSMRELLTAYHKIKQQPRFAAVDGNPDIFTYKTAWELKEQMDKVQALDVDDAKAREGTRALKKLDDLVLFCITNYEAARKIAIEPGSPAPKPEDYNDIMKHAGTGDPGWPWTGWCTQLKGHYESYKGKPLYVVKKGRLPYVQAFFDNPRQANDARNQPISMAMAQAVAPLFLLPELDLPTNTFIDEAKLLDECRKSARYYIAYHTQGHFDTNEKRHIGPTKTKPEAKAELRERIPRQYQLFIHIAQNWKNLTEPWKKAIKVKIARTVRPTDRISNTGYDALMHAVQELTGDQLPYTLKTPEAFYEQYNRILSHI